MAKIINLFGAPGSGKSTTAAGLFWEMRKAGYSVEMSLEWIKLKLFEGSKYPFNDQLYTFAKQHKQLKQLAEKAEYIITDSPLLLSLIYGKNENESFFNLVKEYNSKYDNYNFFVNRDHEYVPELRNQTENESKEISNEIEKVLIENCAQVFTVNSSSSVEEIMNILKNTNVI